MRDSAGSLGETSRLLGGSCPLPQIKDVGTVYMFLRVYSPQYSHTCSIYIFTPKETRCSHEECRERKRNKVHNLVSVLRLASEDASNSKSA